jgi:tetratricopeptide (TPR) repeat protein
LADHSQHGNASGQGSIVVQVAGDGNVVNLLRDEPALWLETFEQGTWGQVTRRAKADAGAEPGWTASGLAEKDLLVAYSRRIAMAGRQSDFARAKAWLVAPPVIGLQVLTGAGGRGKTRFALELCRERRSAGWFAGFVTADELLRFVTNEQIARWGWGRPTLVVIDYAAGKAEQLRALLRALASHPVWGAAPEKRHRLRLLLLERSAARGQGWWPNAFGGTDGEGTAIGQMIDPDSPAELGPITDPADRRAIFTDALRQAMKRAAPLGPEHDQALAGLSWGGEPLFLAMAGLYAARNGVPQALALPADQLALDVAAEELARIKKVWRANGRPAEAEGFAAHMAALATLCGGLDREGAEIAIDREKAALRRAGLGDAPDLRDALADALPGPEGGVAPILPDILGEAAMILAWKETGVAQAAITRALPTHRATVVQAVVRAAQDFAIHGRQAPVAWLRAVLDATSARVELEALSDALPHATVELREVAVAITEKLLALPAAQAGDAAWRALSLNTLSVRLSALGQREAALTAIEEAVEVYRSLAAVRPDAFLPYLAMSLSNLSIAMSDLGRHEAAVPVSDEAVAIRRQLAARQPSEYLPDLATSLHNLSICLSGVKQRQEALAASNEAVAIRRQLAAAQPDNFLPSLSLSLNNLSAIFCVLGRLSDALITIEEAVAIRRRLAATRPDEFLPELTGSLNNLSNCLSGLEMREEALAASEEAVAINRRLAVVRPVAFEPELAGSLTNLSNHLSALRRREAALAASEEAVATYRNLAGARPDTFLPLLAMSLNGLSARLSDLGRGKAALAAIEEAVAIRSRFAAAQPEVFGGDLGQSLAVRAWCYREAGDARAAKRDAEEALGLLEPLVAAGWADMVKFRDFAARIRDTT